MTDLKCVLFAFSAETYAVTIYTTRRINLAGLEPASRQRRHTTTNHRFVSMVYFRRLSRANSRLAQTPAPTQPVRVLLRAISPTVHEGFCGSFGAEITLLLSAKVVLRYVLAARQPAPNISA